MNPIFINYLPACVGSRFSCRLGIIFMSAVLLVLVTGSSSCSTTYGLGQDIEKTGDKIQDAASR